MAGSVENGIDCGKVFEEDAPTVVGATDAELHEALGVTAARPKAKDTRSRNENGMGRVLDRSPLRNRHSVMIIII